MEKMSTPTVREIVRHERKAYRKASKSGKGRILDKLHQLTCYHRESLARMLRDDGPPKKGPIRRPRARKYERILPQLKILWAIAFYACGKRLAPFLPELLSVLVRFGEISATPHEESLLISISPATIDRMLERDRAALKVRGRTTTKPGTLLRSKIPVRTFAEWNEKEPGFFEVDLVGHCGGTGVGEFLYTLNMTDVFSGWIALGAIRGRGEKGTLDAIKSASKLIPFPMKGIDSDNDSSFINWHLDKYCGQEKIKFTRCRPYKKNDQCHVEQKNWSVVRQFIGYRRFETEEQRALLGKIYPLVMAYHNFFSPMMRLAEKQRVGSKVTKRYATAITPYQKLLESNGHIDEATKKHLRREYQATNPADLLRRIRVLSSQLERMSNLGDH
jgi:hypothetical protein